MGTLISVLFVIYLYQMCGITEKELFPFLVVIVGYLLFKSTKGRYSVKENILLVFLAIYVSFVFYIGKIAWKVDSADFLNTKNMLIVLAGVPYIYFLLNFVLCKAARLRLPNNQDGDSKIIGITKKWSWQISTSIMFLCWVPALICNYPGIIISDYTWQYSQAIGESQLNNHHPVVHTLLITISKKIATLIYGGFSAEHTVLINSILQMFVVAFILGYVISSLVKKQNVTIYVAGLILLFISIFPMNALFSVYMTKDVIFSTLLVWFSYEIYNFLMVTNRLKIGRDYSWIKLIPVIISAGFVIVFRNNGFLVVIGTFCAITIIKRKDKGVWILLMLGVCMYLFQTPTLKLMGIPNTELVESIGVPINQVANVIVHDRDITEKQKDLIEDVMPIEDIRNTYNIRYSDHLKFSSAFNASAIQANKGEYLKLWATLFFQYPKDCLEASLNLTIGYWYPGVEKGSVSYDYDSRFQFYEQMGIKNYSTNEYYRRYLTTDVRNSLAESWLWSPGLGVLVMLLLFGVVIIKREYVKGATFIPNMLGWGSLLLATPSYCETRYIYFIFLMIPIWIAIIFTNGDEYNG